MTNEEKILLLGILIGMIVGISIGLIFASVTTL